MAQEYFRYNFKGTEGQRDNTFITLKHERPEHGEVTVGIAHTVKEKLRKHALTSIFSLSKTLKKTVHKYTWNYHDAVLVETDKFDKGLGVLFSSRLEKEGIVPKGSTEKFKQGLRQDGHELKDDDISAFMELMDEPPHKIATEKKPKEKAKLFRLFRKRKSARSK